MYERIGRKPGSVEPSILFEREQGATMPFVSIKAINFDQFLRHQNFLAELQPIDPADDLAKNDATFDMVPGLADPNNPNLFSFAAVNSTLNGFFLRHQDFRLTLQQQPPSAPLGGENSPEFNLFNSDATFIQVPGLSFGFPGFSFQAFTKFPDGHPRFIRHREFHFFIDPVDPNSQQNDFQFTLQPPFIVEPPPPPLE